MVTKIRTAVALAIGLIAGCGSSATNDTEAVGFEDSVLDTYEIQELPGIDALQALGSRPAERFVMSNFLVYRDQAVGEGFEGLTGEEAYSLYVEGLEEAQQGIGSRLVWGGNVDAQVVGQSDPTFQTIAFLEYASPQAFLGFAAQPGENPEARSAGLLGQWLVASTTIDEPAGEVGSASGDTLPGTTALATATGFTEAQVARVLDGPAGEPVHIVELLRFVDGGRETYAQYEAEVAAARTDRGGALVWTASGDAFVIGNGSPAFDEIVLSVYPNRAEYLLTMADPRVADASATRAASVALDWIYTATASADFSL
ncbi:MAG: hypothetical protein AAF500_05670 [Myxococcota bacterium]